MAIPASKNAEQTPEVCVSPDAQIALERKGLVEDLVGSRWKFPHGEGVLVRLAHGPFGLQSAAPTNGFVAKQRTPYCARTAANRTGGVCASSEHYGGGCEFQRANRKGARFSPGNVISVHQFDRSVCQAVTESPNIAPIVSREASFCEGLSLD